MVVPASRVIPGQYDGSVLPFLQSFETIDKIDQEGLQDQGIRIAGVAILIGGGLDKADRGKILRRDSVPEVCDIVLMVRLIAHVADQGDAGRGEVLLIRSGRVILKGLVMRNVVVARPTGRLRMRQSAIPEAAINPNLHVML